MKRNIVFSVKAKDKFQDLLEFLEFKWNAKVRNEFILKLDKSIEIILIMPESFPKSAVSKSQYKCVGTKQTTIYYKFNDKEIRTLALFDTRQHPKKINKV